MKIQSENWEWRSLEKLSRLPHAMLIFNMPILLIAVFLCEPAAAQAYRQLLIQRDQALRKRSINCCEFHSTYCSELIRRHAPCLPFGHPPDCRRT